MRFILVTILVLAPGLAAAQACRGDQQASCAAGEVWDPELGACTDQLVG